VRTVLVVAAEPFEMKWIGHRDGLRYLKVAAGAGPGMATAAMAGSNVPCQAVLSTGLCGALDPGLEVGEIFVAESVNGEPAEIPRMAGKCTRGPLASVDRIVGTVAERQAMFASGFRAVEMEAAAVAQRARSMGVPFYCIRAVSDTATEEFALDLNAARDTLGRIRVSRILAQAARRPVTVVPELLRLRRNAMCAAKALGAFIATCDF